MLVLLRRDEGLAPLPPASKLPKTLEWLQAAENPVPTPARTFAVQLQKHRACIMLIPQIWLMKDLHWPGRTYCGTENDIIWKKGCCARLPVIVQHPSPLIGGGRSVSVCTGTAL